MCLVRSLKLSACALAFGAFVGAASASAEPTDSLAGPRATASATTTTQAPANVPVVDRGPGNVYGAAMTGDTRRAPNRVTPPAVVASNR